MSLPKPNLDDKSFDELVTDALKIIPLNTERWTDFNPADPGVTMVELFAWLTEMQLYYANRIRADHSLKFLQLLGIEKLPARPARVPLTFSAGARVGQVKKGTSCISKATGVSFETDRECEVLPVTIGQLVSFTNFLYKDITGFGQPQFEGFTYPWGNEATHGQIFYLGLNVPPEALGKKLQLWFGLYEDDLIAPGSHDEHDENEFPIESSVKVEWSRWEWSQSVGQSFWRVVEPVGSERVVNLEESGHLMLELPAAGPTSALPWELKKLNPERELAVKSSLIWFRAEVISGAHEVPPRLENILPNTVPATEGISATDRITIPEDQGPFREWRTTHAPILAQGEDLSLELTVDGQPWRRAPDLDGSGPEELHYQVDHEQGIIRFGDHVHGSTPAAKSVIQINYRYGAGRKGNLAKAQVDTVSESKELTVINHYPARGGRDPESLAEAELRLRQELKTVYRAVTAADYEAIAKATLGLRVRRAKALSTGKNHVTVIVVPDSYVKKPIPGSGFLETVRRHLCRHRLVTTKVKVIAPDYVGVTVEASLELQGQIVASRVVDLAKKALEKFIHPLTGGPGGNGWPFGRAVNRSELDMVLMETPGVACVRELSFSQTGPIKPESLVYSGAHTIRVINWDPGCRG